MSTTADSSLRSRRRRRLYPLAGTLAAGALVVVLFQACSGDGPRPTGLDYPSAPEQQSPAPAPEPAGAAGEVPITELVDADWVADTAQRSQIPQRALAAYAGAAAYVGQTDPDCNLGWNTLAAIGQVESVHGQFGDSTVGEDGVVDPPITGVPLDGSEGVMEIEDTDDGELDGDEEWDRAVGPMQIIPATWERYAADGSLDGRTDVHQYDDAALTAAEYLCASGGDLATDEGWNDAVTRYNQSVEYANEVADYAAEYGRG